MNTLLALTVGIVVGVVAVVVLKNYAGIHPYVAGPLGGFAGGMTYHILRK